MTEMGREKVSPKLSSSNRIQACEDTELAKNRRKKKISTGCYI